MGSRFQLAKFETRHTSQVQNQEEKSIMKTRMFLLAALVAIVLTTGFSHMAFAKGGSGGGDKVRIALNGSANYPNADGKASYKVQGAKREFEAEVEHVKKLKGQTVNVFVNGTKVA